MGIKENFSQAVRELTGGGKDEKKTDGKSTVDSMRHAVVAEDTGEFAAISQTGEPERDEFEEIERRAAEAAASYSRRQDELEGLQSESAGRPDTGFGQNQNPEKNAAQTPGFMTNAASGQASGEGQASDESQKSSASGQNPGSGENSFAGRDSFSGGGSVPPPPSNSFSTAPYRPADENEITVISKNTVIDGNIRSFANMSIDGNIKGNVETTKDIDLNGKVVGNIACNNAALRASQVQGNIQMKGNVFMERDTLLIGDITSTYANVNGKIKGNLEITGKAELKSDAVVFGDISASTITVNDGAIIQGYVSTTFLNKEESKSIFPDTITIGE